MRDAAIEFYSARAPNAQSPPNTVPVVPGTHKALLGYENHAGRRRRFLTQMIGGTCKIASLLQLAAKALLTAPLEETPPGARLSAMAGSSLTPALGGPIVQRRGDVPRRAARRVGFARSVAARINFIDSGSIAEMMARPAQFFFRSRCSPAPEIRRRRPRSIDETINVQKSRGQRQACLRSQSAGQAFGTAIEPREYP